MNQPTLRIKHYSTDAHSEYVEISLLNDESAVIENIYYQWESIISSQQQEDLRWYLEDYPTYPQPPAPEIAKRIEDWLNELGTELFTSLFYNRHGEKILKQIYNVIENTKIEIVVSPSKPTTFLWELLRSPEDKLPLCLRARSFYYTIDEPDNINRNASAKESELRILLIISRPRGTKDVSFRSVANSLIKSLKVNETHQFKIDVLRPPTFQKLSAVLQEANQKNLPYHIVHFDGHGIYQDLNAPKFGGSSGKKRGYLLFESDNRAKADLSNEVSYVNGSTLGKLLSANNVPIVVLNACRSDQASEQPKPRQNNEPGETIPPLGSLAQEIIASGVSGVVGMRYNVYLSSAAHFVSNLYSEIASGRNLSESVTISRRQMAERLNENPINSPLKIQDWLVPTVFETNPNYSVFSQDSHTKSNNFSIDEFDENKSQISEKLIDSFLPSPPVTGFIGADEALLTLDKAFYDNPVILIYGFAGGGKSATAIEFGNWYLTTGGVKNAVIYTSFDKYIAPSDVFGQIVQKLEDFRFSQSDYSFQSVREKALALLKEVETLWIWDNVEGIGGFPSGKLSDWSQNEQNELRDFLIEAARTTSTKFLITSRRAEEEWLKDIVFRIYIPYLEVDDRFLLVDSLISENLRNDSSDKSNIDFDISSWYFFLRFTKGNPLVISTLVRHALKERLLGAQQINSFLSQLRNGEDCFEDGLPDRANSIAISLHYKLNEAFNQNELQQLGILHLFQSMISTDVVSGIARYYEKHQRPELKSLTEELLTDLLERLTQLGLLRSFGDGGYSNHPMTPWLFRRTFDRYYERSFAITAFVDSMSKRAALLAAASLGGQPFALRTILNEETNFLYARELAIKERLYNFIPDIMTALREAYEYTARFQSWSNLVSEILPFFVEPETNLPLSGRESVYHIIVDFQALIERKMFRGDEAARLQTIYLEWAEQNSSQNLRAPEVLKDPKFVQYTNEKTGLDPNEYLELFNRLSAVTSKADGLRLSNKKECLPYYEEALNIAGRLNHPTGILIGTFNIALSYLTVSELIDLDKALSWAEQARKICPSDDRWRLGKCYSLLAQIKLAELAAYFQPYLRTDLTAEEFKQFAEINNDCKRYIENAIKVLPNEAVDDLAAINLTAGRYFRKLRDWENALKFLRDSLKYSDRQKDHFRAGITRLLIAITLDNLGQSADAGEYAEQSIKDLTLAGRSDEEIDRIFNKLINEE
jgi:hypothetical protein